MKKQNDALRSRRQGETLTTGRALGAAAAILASSLFTTGLARAQSTPVTLPEKSFPESVTSTSDGALYVGSFNHGGVTRVTPTGKVDAFISPGANGSRSTLGVLADEKNGLLYACSNDLSGLGVPSPGSGKGAFLKTFDLRTGAPKGSFALTDEKSFCNDIAVGGDGTAYITDSFAPYVYSLKPGATALEVWATDPALAPAKDGVGLDGIAVGGDGNLYVTTFIPARLFRIAIENGKAGSITELKPSSALDHADALRPFGSSLLLIEGAGRLDKVTVSGDEARIEVIKDGLTEPVSVAQVGDTGWVAEGKLSYVIGENKNTDPGSFTLKPIALPK